MPSAREEYQKTHRRAIRAISKRLYPPNHARADYIAPEVWADLPISVSRLPFEAHEQSLDFDMRFSRPMDAAQFDRIFEPRFGACGEDLNWPKPDSLPGYTRYADSWARLVRSAVRRTEDHHLGQTTPSMYEYSSWTPCYGFVAREF